MKCTWMYGVAVAAFLFPFSLTAQTGSAPAVCPVNVESFDPSGLSIRIRNTSGKAITGLTFNAALADATEHWKWLHYNFDDTRPLREFGWTKTIKSGESKRLSWGRDDLDFEHGGGGAFVLTSILFADGTSWEDAGDQLTCKALWLNSHKKVFSRPVELPPRG